MKFVNHFSSIVCSKIYDDRMSIFVQIKIRKLANLDLNVF